MQVAAIEHDPTPAIVYNFEVAGTWTYYAEGLWVHNQSCLRERMGNTPFPGAQAHHDLPQKFRDDFEALGIDIDDPMFGRWIDGKKHAGWSKAFNDEWDTFFEEFEQAGTSPTLNDVLGEWHRLRSDPRFR